MMKITKRTKKIKKKGRINQIKNKNLGLDLGRNKAKIKKITDLNHLSKIVIQKVNMNYTKKERTNYFNNNNCLVNK